MYLTRPATVPTTTDIDPLARATIPSAMSNTLQRPSWDGNSVPLALGSSCASRRATASCARSAPCTHRFGWGVVIEVNGLLSRSQVCRSRDEVLDLSERWCAVIVESEWR
jgi:hypothetical protein